MLGTVLEKLQSLLSKSFLISSFFPVLIFAAVNGAILYWVSGPFRGLVHWYYGQDAGSKAVDTAAVLIALAVLAYVFSALSLTLRYVLEGRSLPSSLARRLEARQRVRLRRLEREFEACRTARRELRRAGPRWQQELLAARADGAKLTTNAYTGSTEPAALVIRALMCARDRGQPLEVAGLQDAVDKLSAELRAHSAGVPNADKKYTLDADQQTLFGLIRDAGDRLQNEYLRLFNEKQFNYPWSGLAPTRLGNIAASVRSYADSRYGLDLDIFWSRLQKSVQGDAKFYSVLQDAKTELDFLIAMFWLTVFSTIGWIVALPATSYAFLPFALVWAAGPLVAAASYAIALQSYRAFADLLRSAVDLYRWDLLTSLHIALPSGAEEERQLWTNLGRRTGFGDDVDLAYTRQAK